MQLSKEKKRVMVLEEESSEEDENTNTECYVSCSPGSEMGGGGIWLETCEEFRCFGSLERKSQCGLFRQNIPFLSAPNRSNQIQVG